MQYIKGYAVTVDVLANKGELVFLLARKWCEAWRFPFPGQRIIYNIKIKNLIKKLFKVYYFHGLFDIDIIIDENGKVFMLEINPRPSGSILVSEIIGVKIFSYLEDVLLNRNTEIPIIKGNILIKNL